MNTANAPNYLFEANCTITGNAMYVNGGSSGNAYSNKINKYDIAGNTRTQQTRPLTRDLSTPPM